MPHKDALIVFVRKPEAGKVKTRLAKTLGNEAALQVYLKLLAHTQKVTTPLACDKYTFVTECAGTPFWQGFAQEEQQGADLGARMQNAFEKLFGKGHERVVIIGSDCPALTTAMVCAAFENLKTTDAVLGPTADGGYYLLGMTRLQKALFQNKSWSTETVFAETLADLRGLGLSHQLLPQLTDVDEAADVPAGWLW